ncbi:MAG: SNF2-related protein [Gammaproteobacteria bacterium]
MADVPSTDNIPQDARGWIEAIYAAFASQDTDPLTVADQAVRDCPDDGNLLHLAAIAALVDERPDRCLRYLKRYSKRFYTDRRDQLLRALALAQQGRMAAAYAILEQAHLHHFYAAWPWFAGGPPLEGWFRKLFIRITREGEVNRLKHTRAPARSGASKTTKAARRDETPPPENKPAAAAPPHLAPEIAATELPRLSAAIPISLEFVGGELPPLPDGMGSGQDHDWFRLRGEFAHLGLLQGFDELLCLPLLRGVQTYWYQIETVRKVLKTFRGRVLLADEVGLGKTIEAGMVLKEYLLRSMVERFLVLTPASLVGQWQEELQTKFGIDCITSYDARLRQDAEMFWAQPRIIASIAMARRSEHFARLTRETYDLVIVDEAHHLKNRSTRNYKLVDALKKRFLLLLSATPVQNSLIELYNLLTLLKPGIFKTEKEFRAAYMTPGKPRLPINRERMRDLMRDVMIRNTRALVDVRLPARHSVTVRVPPGGEEHSCYKALDELVREVHASAPGHHRLALHHLVGAAGSSPAAAARAIERFAERHPAEDRWRQLGARYAGIETGAKELALVEILKRNPDEKKMVFAHHRETLHHLDQLLTQQDIAFTRFEGSLPGPEKDAVIATFRDQVPVLLSTESGGEGRNVQFCNTLINFDLPWNPMAIEQRIGRVHRIGQQRDVFVFNLVASNTLEDEVLRILDEKINMFELVVGEIDAILGELEEQQDFSSLVFDAWVTTTAQLRSGAFAELGERMLRAKRQYEAVKQLDDELFGEEFETT